MIQLFLHRLLKRRHFWRYASFSEIAELYASRTLRIAAIHIGSGFASVYLYKEGYSLVCIVGLWACFYAFKVLVTYFAARYAARFGPKHGTLLSNLLYIPAMVCLALAPTFGMPIIIAWLVLMGLSSTLYEICYNIDFSKVKNADHAGKELGFMNILEKLAIGISPVIGGVIALYFGPEITMLVASALFAGAALPLLQTAEPTKTHQKITFRGFPWRNTYRSFIAEAGRGFDVLTSGTLWNLFLVAIIFSTLGDEIYVTIGTLASVTILAAITASFIYGRLIDKHQGGNLLKGSVIVNSFIHLIRPFVGSPVGIVSINITNEAATTGYNMAYLRGVYDTADISGHRITYLLVMDAFANLGGAFACAGMLILLANFDDLMSFKIFFVIAAVVGLLIATAHFRLYRK